MKNHFLLCTLLIFLCYFSAQAQTNNSGKVDTVFYKTTLVPIEAQQPTITTKTIISDSLDFQVSLISDSIVIKFSGNSFKIESIDRLDKFIKDNNISNVSPKIYLESSKETPIEEIEKVIQVLRNNGIERFNFSTRSY